MVLEGAAREVHVVEVCLGAMGTTDFNSPLGYNKVGVLVVQWSLSL